MNASEFWQAYFDEIEKTTAGPLIDFKLEMEREVTGKSRGDYDPGWVNVRLSVKNLRNRRLIYEREAEVRLDDVIFGRFSADATREEIQRKAFEATEKKIFRVRLFWNGGFGMSHSGKGSSHLTRLRWRPLTGTTLPST